MHFGETSISHKSSSAITTRAHFVALVLPDGEGLGEDSDAIETWYTDEVYALTQAKQNHNVLPKAFLKANEIPDAVASRMSQFLQGHHGDESPVRVLITATPSSDPTNFHQQFSTKFFHPFVLNYVGRTTEAKANRDHVPGEGANMEGYGICFTNSDRSSDVRVIYDVVLMTDKTNDGDVGGDKSQFQKDAHLTPLEVSLDESIRAANAVLQEMRYMEKREARMRKTAEDINTRVRWFSYLSVSVLLAVTYIQVSYLKRYFHKKKLM
jgi:p24 family protein delta-1